MCATLTVLSSLISPAKVLQTHEMLLKVVLFICGLIPQHCLLCTSPKCFSVCQTSVGRINLSSCAVVGLFPFDILSFPSSPAAALCDSVFARTTKNHRWVKDIVKFTQNKKNCEVEISFQLLFY